MVSSGQMQYLITLLPPEREETNSFGERVKSDDPTRYEVWASWEESKGTEGIDAGQLVGALPVRVRGWMDDAITGLSADWTLLSEEGERFNISSVHRYGDRREYFEIQATRRS